MTAQTSLQKAYGQVWKAYCQINGLKLLWSPLVESLYTPAFGCRKWAVSCQYLLCISLSLSLSFLNLACNQTWHTPHIVETGNTRADAYVNPKPQHGKP